MPASNFSWFSEIKKNFEYYKYTVTFSSKRVFLDLMKQKLIIVLNMQLCHVRQINKHQLYINGFAIIYQWVIKNFRNKKGWIDASIPKQKNKYNNRK